MPSEELECFFEPGFLRRVISFEGLFRRNKMKANSGGISGHSATVTVLFGAVLLCLIWAGLFLKVQNERQLEINNAIKDIATHARMFEEHTERTIKGLDQIAIFLKYQVEKDGWNIDIPKYISEKRFEGQPYVLLSVVNEKGGLVASSQVPFVFSTIRDREHFQVHMGTDSGKLFVSKPVLGRSSGKWSIQLTRRINKVDGSFGGVVVVSIDPFYFSGFYKQVELGEDSLIAIIGNDGIMRIRQTDKEGTLGQDFSKSTLMEQMMRSKSGYYWDKSRVDGINRIFSFYSLPDYPLAVVVGISETQVFNALNHRIVFYYWAAGGTSALIILFVLLLLVEFKRRTKAVEKLRMSEAKLRLLLESTGEAIYGIDLQGNCTFANPSCLKILGYSDMSQLLGVNMHELVHHSYPDGRLMPSDDCRIFKAFLEGRQVHVDDEFFWKSDGTNFPVECWSYPQLENGKVTGAVVAFNDITKRKQAEEVMALQRRRLADIIEGTNAGTWEWKVSSGELTINERWAEIIGYTLEELAPVSIETWIKYVHPDDLKTSNDLLQGHFNKELEFYECEVRMLHKNNSWVWVLDKGRVSSWGEDGKPLFASGTHLDITARKRMEEVLEESNRKLEVLSITDALTGIANRRRFDEQMAREHARHVRTGAELSVILLDIDHFKAFNDTYGHVYGDDCLRRVARALAECVARPGDLVARYGGEEFVFILPETSLSGAVELAEKIRRSVLNLSIPHQSSPTSEYVTISLGVACFRCGAGKQAVDTDVWGIANSFENTVCFH